MESKRHKQTLNPEISRGIAVVATGDYNMYVNDLIKSAHKFFRCHVYLFTDRPSDYAHFNDITTIKTPHIRWPAMPLLRFELFNRHKDLFKEDYMFLMDADVEFVQPVTDDILKLRVACLHRNIMRMRKDFNYETRKASTAYIAGNEGEKYYACAWSGGQLREFKIMLETVSGNIRADIEKGVRAIWGDESHINRFFIDRKPHLVLPPSYMCPENNRHFIPIVTHQNKPFKSVFLGDVEKHKKIDKAEYEQYLDLFDRS